MTENEAISRIKDHMEIHRLKEPRTIYITVALSMVISTLKEIQQYRKIGTVEECREAAEKLPKAEETRQLLNLVKLDIVEITVRDRKTKRKYTWEE